jgi:capsular exopolysaccharide synthesis family protein
MTTAPTRNPADPRTPQQRPRPAAAAAASVTIDPIRVLRQHAVALGGSVFVGLGLGFAANIVLDQVYPLYSDTVLFELVPAPEGVSEVIVRDQRTEEAVERLGQTESARIRSRDLLEAAMNSRDIEATKWSESYRDENGQFVPAEAVDDLIEELGTGHVRKQNFFQISWSTHEASDVPVVLNRIAETYLARKKAIDDARFEQNRQTFRRQLDDLDSQLSSIGKEISKFVADKNLTSTSEERNNYLVAVEDTARRVNETKSLLTLSQSRKQQTEAKMEGLLEPTPDDIRTAEEDPQIQQSNNALREVKVEAETYRKKFANDHPALISMQKRVVAAELERDSKLQEILRRNLNADFKTFSDQTESYQGLLEKFEQDLETLSVRLKDFTANVSSMQELKDRRERLLEARQKQLEVLADLDQLKARDDARSVTIAKSASTPREKSFPKLKLMLPLGAVLTLGITLAFVFLREMLDTRIRYATDLGAINGLRLLGSVPDLAEDPVGLKKIERVVRENPKSVVAEVCRQISGQVRKAATQGGIRSIACLSGLPEAGTTSFISNLADSLAMGGLKVLVIDANFRRSHLAAAMGTEPDAVGLGDVLRGQTTLADAIRPAGGDVDILAAGTPESRVFEMLSTPKLDAVISEASSRYDMVLVDVPPVVVAGDALAVANKVDGTIIVVRAFQEQRGLVARIASQLGDVKAHLIGAVLNRPRNTAGGYLRKNYETMASYSTQSDSKA